MKNKYELAILQNNKPYLTLFIESIFEDRNAYRKIRDVLKRFPSAEGFSCNITQWLGSNQPINIVGNH